MPSRPTARAVAALLLLAACSSDGEPSVLAADDVACTQDVASDAAKDTVERVGGLVTDDFVVKLVESTRAGVVALVEGDVTAAYDRLHGTYGVTVVARLDRADDAARVTGFRQVRDLVAATCG